jgi:hypothetical protein
MLVGRIWSRHGSDLLKDSLTSVKVYEYCITNDNAHCFIKFLLLVNHEMHLAVKAVLTEDQTSMSWDQLSGWFRPNYGTTRASVSSWTGKTREEKLPLRTCGRIHTTK